MLPDTVATFSQVNAMAGLATTSAAANNGACHNFTLDWISRMIADDGQVTPALASGRIARLSQNNGAGNPVLQKVFGQRWVEDRNSYREADTMMILVRGLKEVELAFDKVPFSGTQLINELTAPKGPGMVYSFWFRGSVVGAPGGAHTIGFFRRLRPAGGALVPADTHVSCFDPNFGECHVHEANLVYWLNRMMACYGAPVRHMLKVVDKA